MIFLSELMRRRVIDTSGRFLGRVVDLVVSSSEVFPSVTALVVEHLARRIVVPWDAVHDFQASPIQVTFEAAGVDKDAAFGDMWLARDVLDHQIVDTKGRRVVKVNDLKLTKIRGQARLVGADVSLRGYLRRLGMDGLIRSLRLPVRERLITWNYVDYLGVDQSELRLNVAGAGLTALHPADIADLLDDLNVDEGATLLGRLSDPVAAEALSELNAGAQEGLLERIGTERAADLLEILPADEAADILGDLPDEQAEAYLAGMNPLEAAEVRELLAYDEESAGGIMSPEVFAIRDDLTVDDAIGLLRSLASEAEVAYHLFVVDAERRLAGVISLRDLITAAPRTKLASIMQTQIVRVDVNTDQEAAARLMSKYDLLGLPVVDDEGRLVGIITADDIIDVIQEEADEDLSAIAGTTTRDVEGESGVIESALARLRWLAVGLVGGLASAVLLRAFVVEENRVSSVLAFGPLLVLIAGQVVAQSLAVVTRGLGLGIEEDIPLREAQVGIVVASTSGLFGGIGAALVVGSSSGVAIGLAVGISICLTTVLAAAVGTILPFLLARGLTRPRFVGQPFVAPIVGLVSVAIYLGLAAALVGRRAG